MPDRTGPQVLETELLALRAKVLEVAAGLDRIDRAGGVPDDDRHLQALHAAIEILREGSPGRAERVQLVFSREYQGDWRQRFELSPRR